MPVSENKDAVVLNDNVRGKGFILENFYLNHHHTHFPFTQKADSCRSNHLIFYVEDIQDNFIR